MAGMNGTGSTAVSGQGDGEDRVVLVRHRTDLAGQAARTVHLVFHRPSATSGAAVVALCGVLLVGEQIETVAPGEGMPCTMCLLLRSSTRRSPVSADPPASPCGDTASLTPTTAATYRAWDWPVLLRGDRVLLSLDGQAAATIIPTDLAVDVLSILTARRCPVAVLAHSHAPEHQVLLSGEPYGVPLPWPPQVHPAGGAVPLPPTVTPGGPVSWAQRPQPHALWMSREIDVFAAVRTALRSSGP